MLTVDIKSTQFNTIVKDQVQRKVLHLNHVELFLLDPGLSFHHALRFKAIGLQRLSWKVSMQEELWRALSL